MLNLDFAVLSPTSFLPLQNKTSTPSSAQPSCHLATHTHTRAHARTHARTHAHTHTHKLPYARDSWQTLAQTIHGLPKLGRCSCRFSEAALWRPKVGKPHWRRMVRSPSSASLLHRVWSGSAKTVEAGRQLVRHDDQRRPVGRSQMSFPQFPSRTKENGRLYKCCEIHLWAIRNY